MQANDPRDKAKQDDTRQDSTGKAYERLVEELFMGGSSDEEEANDDSE